MATTLVTGGAGFIGSHLADRLLARGATVRVLDDLSRVGSRLNLEWLRDRHGEVSLTFQQGDVRDAQTVAMATAGVDWIVHLAGQVAVTSSLADPRSDFEANALGTLNVLEAARARGRGPVVLYASTNKVYGSLDDLGLVEEPTRWSFAEADYAVSEQRPLDPCSPYGCSKAAGDCYVRDYNRIYGVRTVVCRQSCIYGPRQMGVEDQGWVAWLTLAALRDGRVRVFGDGKQVRDLLWIDDLLDVYERTFERIDEVEGEVFNIGGGRESSLSVWAELGPELEQSLGHEVVAEYHPARPGDQRIYLSDSSKAERLLGWRPRVMAKEGLDLLVKSTKEGEAIRSGATRLSLHD